MELSFIIIGLLFIVCVLSSKLSDRYSIPSLLIFLGIGMLAGSDGLLKIEFDNAQLAGDLGTIALIFILFAGGLNTSYKAIKPVLKEGFILSTFGVLITSAVLSLFIYIVFNISFQISFLIACIISSTDAAAVFSILRLKKIKLKNNIGELLELESGSNDPMAIFLTMMVINIISAPVLPSNYELFIYFIAQFVVGGIFGIGLGFLLPKIINKVRLSVWGLYPVLVIAIIIFSFGITSLLGGNGYIAIYVAGIFINAKDFVHKKNLIGFFDGVSWLMQVLIFMALGLLVFPSQLSEITLASVILALFLIFIARPIAVFSGLIFSNFSTKEKYFISWVGLRGVVPIVLATYPIAAGIENSGIIFNLVFMVVIISVLVQGTSLSWVAERLNVKDENDNPDLNLPNQQIIYGGLKEIIIPHNAKVIGCNLAELELDKSVLLLLIKRDEDSFKPTGSYIFEENDLILVYCENNIIFNNVKNILVEKSQ